VRRVVVSEFVTLDGVFEDPGGVEGFSCGGWAFGYERGPEGDRFKLDEILDAEALLLGRKTYEAFAAAWPSRSDDSGFAEKMNTIPKYVASSTLRQAAWNNSTVLSGALAADVSALVSDGDGTILVVGSGTVVRQLLEHDLIDEIRLMVFPTALGRGATLFAGLGHPARFALRETQPLGDTVLLTLHHDTPPTAAKD
jgi:dihydrofolate reductase